jgi:hypothetical protein
MVGAGVLLAAALAGLLISIYVGFRRQAAMFSVAGDGSRSCERECAEGGGRPSRRGAAAAAQADSRTGRPGPLGEPNGAPVYCRCAKGGVAR